MLHFLMPRDRSSQTSQTHHTTTGHSFAHARPPLAKHSDARGADALQSDSTGVLSGITTVWQHMLGPPNTFTLLNDNNAFTYRLTVCTDTTQLPPPSCFSTPLALSREQCRANVHNNTCCKLSFKHNTYAMRLPVGSSLAQCTTHAMRLKGPGRLVTDQGYDKCYCMYQYQKDDRSAASRPSNATCDKLSLIAGGTLSSCYRPTAIKHTCPSHRAWQPAAWPSHMQH